MRYGLKAGDAANRGGIAASGFRDRSLSVVIRALQSPIEVSRGRFYEKQITV